MKTTIDLPDDLLERAKSAAAAENTTLRALVTEGLRWVLSRRRGRGERFVLRDAGVTGDGIASGLTEGDWSTIRDAIYRGRGT